MEDKRVIADEVVDSLRYSLHHSATGLSNVPGLLKRILEENLWRERVVAKTGEVVSFNTFIDFVTTPPLEGLGTTPELVESIIKSDAEALKLYRGATRNKRGRKGKEQFCNNITELPSITGTSKAYACEKLSNERPDLFEQVKSGEKSAHAAMVEAGFRKKKTPLEQALYWYGRLSKADKKRFCDEVGI